MDKDLLLSVSAFSGLAGALLTQLLVGLFAYFNDKRKSDIEVKHLLRNKKIEIAESFYYMTNETMSVLRKSIGFWQNRNDSHSDASLMFLSEEIKKLNTRLEKLNAENWRYNLIGLYFDVSLSYNEIIEANTKSHLLYLKVLDIADKINKADETDHDFLYGQYNLSIFDLCNQYDYIYKRLSSDMEKIKTELLNSYK